MIERTGFDKWWHEIGSGIVPIDGGDLETFAKTVARNAYNAALKDHGLELSPGKRMDQLARERFKRDANWGTMYAGKFLARMTDDELLEVLLETVRGYRNELKIREGDIV
jgi:hypothetical protein